MTYQPDIHAFFPKTRRGHGTTHPEARTRGGETVRQSCRCVNDACSLHRRQDGDGKKPKGEAHLDAKANAADWKIERGYGKDVPLEMCKSRVS